ncbi:glycosyltransferase involved in cell wall biosynthesis [Diaminobutyricimonas aerilata]|uniref:4,4'-diaponeurosporenoate glycosyltransferase n=1 Tax=Diaminobutyricimonas aerilata TaxID=1162967 RepID=A0A2M9CH97_9MICO|nr:glycosyltransferase family 2 protein [Diaminobutyricimonas aerilata]PJJ71225.1 glycosyltransferase involved in cell wall biosynthesis [Diaminobutyricimonas aerilata]
MDVELSVVIPAYNSAPWLPSTLDALADALAQADMPFEILVVDDGSTDDTSSVVRTWSTTHQVPVRILRQTNSGRFLARWAGVTAAAGSRLLLLDSRVLLHRGALAHVEAVERRSQQQETWNAHVVTDGAGPLVTLFWEVPVHVFWGRYLRAPRATHIDLRNFDRLPKGTTAFLVERMSFLEAARACWPEGDARFVSDDTRLLRYLCARSSLRLDPSFSATYRARTSLGAFLAHARDRGTLFVDSYAGTSVFRTVTLLLLVAAPIAILTVIAWLALAGAWTGAAAVLIASLVALALPAALALRNGVAHRAVASYFAYSVPFALWFWAGLTRGAIIHRRKFVRASRVTEEAS